ncbi:MAG: hypothetical protein JWR53_817 [Glaciihabitans sp.]|jgi:hypothetical protein|nr:hypothetical protein [Glaciihabitans sp.]
MLHDERRPNHTVFRSKGVSLRLDAQEVADEVRAAANINCLGLAILSPRKQSTTSSPNSTAAVVIDTGPNERNSAHSELNGDRLFTRVERGFLALTTR